MKHTLLEVYNRLLSYYGDPHWWPAETPYEVIVGAVLTQNTAWSNVEKAIANFGDNLSSEFVSTLLHCELAEIIRPAGFFNQKAGYLQEITRWFGQYKYNVDAVRECPLEQIRPELLAVKGVGRETADSILLYAFGFPTFVVDAYTMRLIERLPLDAGRDYETVKAYFEQHIPRDAELYNIYHALIVLNGKDFCRKKPMCGDCPLTEICEKKGSTH